MASIRYAHTLEGRPETDWHPLETHLRDTACSARNFASAFGWGDWGQLVGLWHDLGKFSDAFQDYLRASSPLGGGAHAGEISGRVDHSTAGRNMPRVWDRWGGCSPTASRAIMPVSPTTKAANPDCPPACSSTSSRSCRSQFRS